MSTRAYFFGGPADGTVREFPVRPPSHTQVENRQHELALPATGCGAVRAERTTYKLLSLIDDDGRATYIYLAPQTKLSAVLRRSFELYVEVARNENPEH